LYIEGNTLTYKDHSTFKTFTIRCLEPDLGVGERFPAFARTQWWVLITTAKFITVWWFTPYAFFCYSQFWQPWLLIFMVLLTIFRHILSQNQKVCSLITLMMCNL